MGKTGRLPLLGKLCRMLTDVAAAATGDVTITWGHSSGKLLEITSELFMQMTLKS